MSGEIQLTLTVDDKGSLVVRQATNQMSANLEQARSSASRLNGTFSGLGHTIASIAGRMFSLRNIIGTIAGGAGLGLLGKKIVELGSEAEGAEVFKEKVEGLSSAWKGFTGSLGIVISQNPVIQDVLAAMSTKVTDWGKALIENKEVINDWFETAKSAAEGVGSVVEAATRRVRSAAQTLQQSMATGGAGLIPGGYIGEGGEVAPNMGIRPGSDAYWESQYPASGGNESYWQNQVGSPINVYFNGPTTRSDVQNIISEMERRTFRDDGAPPDAGF